MEEQKPKLFSDMRKTILGIFVVAFALFYAFDSYQQPDNQVIVAISQIIEHDSLDEERKGIIKALADAGYVEGRNLKLIYENAQGSIPNSAQIAYKLVSLKPKVLVAISTPSAQSLVEFCQKYNIPLVFTAVTNPEEAKLILKGKQCDITGVSDYIPSAKHFELIEHIVPKIKRIGIIYNAGEANSIAQVKDIKQEAENRNIELIIATANKTGNVSAATERLVGARVDCIYIPNDNTAVSAMESIVTVAIKGYVDDNNKRRSIPVIAGDSGSVKKGALATVGYRRDMLGYKAGQQVVRILNGEKANTIPIERGAEIVNMFNTDTADKMNITISPALMLDAVLVKRKGK